MRKEEKLIFINFKQSDFACLDQYCFHKYLYQAHPQGFDITNVSLSLNYPAISFKAHKQTCFLSKRIEEGGKKDTKTRMSLAEAEQIER